MTRESPQEVDRRQFLIAGGSVVLGAASAGASGTGRHTPQANADRLTPIGDDEQSLTDAAAAMAHSPLNAEDISVRSIVEAERLAGINFSPAQRTTMMKTIGEQIARLQSRQQYPHLANERAAAQTFDPRLPWMSFDHLHDRFRRSFDEPGPLPDDDESIAFSPVSKLSRWIERGELTSTRLTRLYLDRLQRFDPQLECVITLTDELALQQAAQADAEISRGNYFGPLHGIPWGAKDLLDTDGIPTTWGATPFKHRVPHRDATVVRKLHEAGAVLVAKLTLGALAYNDIWFGGRTNNPWNTAEGSSGSSAGSAAATAAGLVGFSIGTETYGSIVSPCMECGATGLRPTFGRVSRQGAMALCWSVDKVGPICRTVEDCLLVLDAIDGWDEGDPSSISMPLDIDAQRSVHGLRLGYDPAWFDPGNEAAHDLDRQALLTAGNLGIDLIPIELPDLPYDSLVNILFCEGAAAFEELTRTGLDETLRWQEPRAWPNMFRQAWFIPGVELVQAERVRRQCMEKLADQLETLDGLIGPSFAPPLLLVTNFTGHPSLTLRTGFKADGNPHGITIIGNLFDEGTLGAIGIALERAMGAWQRRPEL